LVQNVEDLLPLEQFRIEIQDLRTDNAAILHCDAEEGM
jgi:hypothetical protein